MQFNNAIDRYKLELDIRSDCPVPVSPERWQAWFSTWLRLMGVEQPCELSLYLTDDDRMRELNQRYRQLDRSTDVLAFAAREAPLPDRTEQNSDRTELPILLGDIAISIPTARAQAKERGHALTAELAWLASHGLLHLIGWDHPDEASLQRMLQQQGQLIGQIEAIGQIELTADPDITA
ncbi:rRNA maturation RNase YbeY [Synechococcus sp. PCC 7336]|uniref:rRNA maturation RNase YbeY n=1 Tax=Synechococcus sp. PCC 7336 TaxID=195250 RepID=UPI00034BF66F